MSEPTLQRQYLFLFLIMCAYVCKCLGRPEVWNLPGTEITAACERLHVDLNSDLLQKQYVLLSTESFFPTPKYVLLIV